MADRQIACPKCGHRFLQGGEDTTAQSDAARTAPPPSVQPRPDPRQRLLVGLVIGAVCLLMVVGLVLAVAFGYTIYGLHQLMNDLRSGP